MRPTFARMADRRPVETLVERDDGVIFAMRGAGFPLERLRAAAEAVRESAVRWAGLRPGETWVLEWPLIRPA